jgi:hypothetical protein
VFRAGEVPERPHKVGPGPLRSLRPGGASASDPTLCGSSGVGVSTLALVAQGDGVSPAA